jgi:4-amino-4-deoxy-L-arabinose transferase-like glycosyltransferase
VKAVVPYAATVFSFAVGLVQKWPCHSAGWPYDRALIFGKACYSDLPVLFADRGFDTGTFPYATQRSFEYPVMLGYLADVTARVSSSGAAFFLVNLFVLLVCSLVTVWATIRLTGRWQAGLIVGLSPVLMLTGTINWDMVPVMFVSLAMLAWARERPALAGLAIGLGAATKLYPALLLFPLLLLTFTSRRWLPLLRAVGVAALSWAVVNLPVMALYPAGWAVFWRLNAERPADFGSIFYALDLLGRPVPSLNSVAIVLFGLCLVAIAFVKPRRLEVLTLLTIAAFLMTNKVYSPQYVLWLLPLAVVAGAPLFALLVWQAAEVAYWWAVWQYLDGGMPGPSYATVSLVRVGAELMLCLAVLANRQLLPGEPVLGQGHPAEPEEVQRDIAGLRRV